MRNLKVILQLITVLIILPLLSGCAQQAEITEKLSTGTIASIDNQQSANSTTKTSTVSEQVETYSSTVEQPDDLITVPGGMGPQYRANVTQAGETNPCEPIESVTATLGNAEITYRDYIQTEAGQTRNNIFRIFLSSIIPLELDTEQMKVKLSATALPYGFSISQDGIVSGAMPSKRAQTNLRINIDSSVAPGEYPLDIKVNINGKDHGTVNCTIAVE